MKYQTNDVAFRLAKDYKRIEEVKELEGVQAMIKDLLMESNMRDAGYRSDGNE